MRRLLTSLGLAALALASCGSDDAGTPSLSPDADEGRRIVQSNGCAACHGSNGGGGVGPPFVGLYGGDVELADGTTVVADEEYLRRAIRDPGADVVAGYRMSMPTVDLSDEEVDSVIAFIRELSGEANP